MADRTVSPPADTGQPISGRARSKTPPRALDPLSDAPGPAPGGLLTADKASIWLAISRSQLYRLVKEEGLPAVRVGKSLRFRVADLERWLDGRRTAK